jgi:hypothetical protein
MSFSPAGSMIRPRRWHSATLLPDGRVLVTGGGANAEVWEPTATDSPDADTTASTTPDLLPGVDLITEEVEPGVYRVVSDGIRDLSGRVRDVAVSADGEVWVELGTSRNWSVVRLGEPGVSQTLGRKEPWRLGLTASGVPLVASSGGTKVLEGGAWAKPDSTAYYECVLPLHGRTVVGTDGGCWTVVNRGDAVLERIDADGTRTVFTRAGLGLEADQRTGEPDVAPDGRILISVHRPAGRGVTFEGLLEYDGSTWSSIPYDGDDTEAVDGGDAVDADGVYWALRGVIGASEILSWDGESWTSHPLELEEGRNWDLLPVQPWPNGIVWFGSDARWDGSTLDAAERAVQWGKGLAPAAAPDGSVWTVIEEQLYVITPEAVAE